MDHLHFLRERPGREIVEPADAARDFLEDLSSGSEMPDE
jgi:hypothetical protein